LLRKDQPWDWTEEQQVAFETMKAAYASEPVLLCPDYTKPFRLQCDASLVASGGVLLQDDTNGQEHPIAFFSKAHSPAERNYMTYDREFLAIILCLREWRHFIIGSPHQTIVFTDHQNLTYFQQPQRLTRRQARWVAELMEYDLKLTHKKGKEMIVADALSRRTDHSQGLEADNKDVTALPEDLWIKLLDTELRDAVAKAQLGDKYAQEVLLSLNDPEQSPVKWTTEAYPNGTLALFYDGRMYIPDDLELRRQIVADHHDTSLAGHPGILATTHSVRTSYYWPGLQHFIKNYVNGCAICQQFKKNTRPMKPALHPIPSGSSRLFGSLGIDFMTDLPLSEDGFDSIMVMVDHGLSKGIILTPCNKKGLDAEMTSRLFLDNVFSRFGLPDKIMTDRGVQFDAAFFRELCAQLGIKPSMTTAFHPQANGGTERVNQEVQLYLSIFCINNPSSWSRALKKAEFVYNNRPHADQSQSPFELMYGQAPLAMPEAFGHSENPSVEARIAQLNQWRKDAILAHEHARERMKTRIRESYTPFAKGDKVWLEARNLIRTYNKKITTKREGPFVITEVLGPLNYRLKLPEGWKIHPVFHASLLSPYVENGTHGRNFPRPAPDLIDNQEEWEVERILRHKGTKNISYQVKWHGYEDPTWEPEKNLANAADIITDYWKRVASKKTRNP
jgi:transposase InsO family protein